MKILNSKTYMMLLVTSAFLVGCGTADNGTATATTGATSTTSNTAPGVTAIASGPAGSIVLGTGTKIVEVSTTQYSLPMSVQVVDSYGAAVANSVVNLSVWPKFYKFGRWYPQNASQSPNADCIPVAFPVAGSTVVPNEDINKNLVLDLGENIAQTVTSIVLDSYGSPTRDPATGKIVLGPPFLAPANDGILTPYSASAGTFVQDASLQPIQSVITDASGTANFSLLYLKAYAPWIVAELKATTPVIGTQTTAVINLTLKYLKSESTNCSLRNSFGGSPFNDPSW